MECSVQHLLLIITTTEYQVYFHKNFYEVNFHVNAGPLKGNLIKKELDVQEIYEGKIGREKLE